MRSWGLFLGGLLVWAAHFFLLYSIASIFLSTLLARSLAGGATILAIGLDVMLLVKAKRRLRASNERLDRWLAGSGLLLAALSLIAVVWQSIAIVLA
jgi:hypothetical protein